ncbi:MAG: Gfo/Idh/MocA family protein [Flavobacteriaceae bacterium]
MEQKKKIRAAVIGLGYFGRFHARHYSEHPDADLVAVVDLDEERRKAASREFGGEPVADYMDLVGKIDVASIAVPTSRHAEVATKLMQAGIHVLVEKPITDSVESAQALVDLARERNLVLQVGHIERFSAAFRELSARCSTPLYIEAHRISPFKPRATDVDVVLDLMIHDIDIILGLVGSPIMSVHAVGAPVLNRTEDIANARLEFENGAVANITASRVAGKTERRTRIFQPDAYLVCDFGNSQLVRFRRTGDPEKEGINAIGFESWNIPKEDSLRNEISEFLDCVATGRIPTVDGRVGREALRVASMINESLREHQARVQAHLGDRLKPQPS